MAFALQCAPAESNSKSVTLTNGCVPSDLRVQYQDGCEMAKDVHDFKINERKKEVG